MEQVKKNQALPLLCGGSSPCAPVGYIPLSTSVWLLLTRLCFSRPCRRVLGNASVPCCGYAAIRYRAHGAGELAVLDEPSRSRRLPALAQSRTRPRSRQGDRVPLQPRPLPLPPAQLLSTILFQDCLLFCPISQPDLKRDFARDSATHCCAALVDSLLALGALAAKDHARLAVALAAPSSAPNPDSLAQAFAYEAMFALHNGTGRPRRIVDIQSFGILSLYNVSCYRLEQATEFAGDFCAAIAELWRAERSSETHASSRLDKTEHASLYCAAVSLSRCVSASASSI